MRAALLLLLWSALVGTSREVQCFHCLATNNSASCKAITCIRPSFLCFSHEVIFKLGSEQHTLITRSCTSTCDFKSPPEWAMLSPNMIVMAKALCCSKSLCNGGPSGGPGARTWHRGLLLGMGLGLQRLL